MRDNRSLNRNINSASLFLFDKVDPTFTVL